jgi:hypothetical protein
MPPKKDPKRAKPYQPKEKDVRGSYNVFFTKLNWQSGRTSDHREFVQDAKSKKDAINQATTEKKLGGRNFSLVTAVAVLVAALEVVGLHSFNVLGILIVIWIVVRLTEGGGRRR